MGFVAFVLALALPLAACSSEEGGSDDGSTTGSNGGGGGGTTIVIQDFAFSPASLDVSAGQVTLTVTNEDSADHTFTLDDGSSDTEIAGGETAEIPLDVSATVGFHCEIHPSMTGTLNVG